MVFRIADDGDLAAVFANDLAFGYGVGRVVGTFCVIVGSDRVDELFDGRLVENGHGIDKSESRNDLGAFAFGDVWAVFALQNPDLAVRIYPDNQKAAESLRPSEIADVAGVQKVEAAVGKDDLIIVRSLFGDAADQFIA